MRPWREWTSGSKRSQARLAVTVSLANGRTQTVFVEEAEVAAWSAQIVRVYSVCGPAEESYFRRALRLNAEVPHGSLAIESLDGVDHFVMLHSYPAPLATRWRSGTASVISRGGQTMWSIC